jgi:hypothetical protein
VKLVVVCGIFAGVVVPSVGTVGGKVGAHSVVVSINVSK